MISNAKILHGIPVVLHQRIQTGTNSLNEPVFKTEPVTVENVLVYPATADDVTNTQQIYGKRASYTVGIPKGDAHQWEDAVIEFFGRKWHTVGIVQYGISDLVPLEWNGKIIVETFGDSDGPAHD